MKNYISYNSIDANCLNIANNRIFPEKSVTYIILQLTEMCLWIYYFYIQFHRQANSIIRDNGKYGNVIMY